MPVHAGRPLRVPGVPLFFRHDRNLCRPRGGTT